jgi:DNA-binding FadR family transcriptional regulator
MALPDKAGTHLRSGPQSFKRAKLPELIVEEIKRWIVGSGMKPGDRLPQERELIEIFQVSKGTIRESLKSLEVQGMVRINTGPGGGASIAQVSYEHMSQLLGNYFYFHELGVEQIYSLRVLVEPEMAVSTVGQLTEAHYARLEDSIASCCEPAETDDARRSQRSQELEFHNIVAEACPNSLLSFMCRFINKLLIDLVVMKQMYAGQHSDMAQSNLGSHRALLEAFRNEDKQAVFTLMRDHMIEAESKVKELEAVMQRRFLGQGPSLEAGR